MRTSKQDCVDLFGWNHHRSFPRATPQRMDLDDSRYIFSFSMPCVKHLLSPDNWHDLCDRSAERAKVLDANPTLNRALRRTTMKSNLIIKDLSLDKALDRKAMSSVRGGVGNQANATQQGNFQEMFAPVAVGNGANFGAVAQ
ncbi:hypothetical protein PA01_18580 [Azoarcus sp. PA01]|nr:hypothetical protein PA01_18580 [Azoarcus sp. PA01]